MDEAARPRPGLLAAFATMIGGDGGDGSGANFLLLPLLLLLLILLSLPVVLPFSPWKSFDRRSGLIFAAVGDDGGADGSCAAFSGSPRAR